MIKKNQENCVDLEVHDMAMNHIANSDTIQFLQSLNIDLSVFFQALWRHVICIEYFKLFNDTAAKDKFQFSLKKFLDSLQKNKIRQNIEKFISDNEERFWNTVDENIIELTNKLEKDINVEMGAEVKKYTAKAGYARGLSEEKKKHLTQRAKKFINSGTMNELGKVVSSLSDYSESQNDKYYILIDRLDEQWVDEKIKYQLIQSLFEALKGLQKIRNLKVIVALRNDVYEKTVHETSPSYAQVEKYNDYIVRLKWSKAQLWELSEKRINHLFKRKYSKENVCFNDVFQRNLLGKETTWSYMVDRTLYRPRDIINFVNDVLQKSEGKSTVSRNDFKKGEHTYSEARLEAITFEWHEVYPGIKALIEMLQNKPPHFGVSEFNASHFVEALWTVLGEQETTRNDELWKLSDKKDCEPIRCCQAYFSRLHLIGALGLKVTSSDSWQFFHETGKKVREHEVHSSTKVKIHPMLYYALGVSSKPYA